MKQINLIIHNSLLLASLLLMVLSGCRAYKQDILFNIDEGTSAEPLSSAIAQAEGNYIIQANDWLQMEVFTHNGERLIDPNFELSTNINSQVVQTKDRYQYLVQTGGIVKFPIVGDITVAGLTIDQAEETLESEYNQYYKDSFVKIKINNRRVIVLGGEIGAVIPLPNDKMNIVEVLALYGGIPEGSKAHNIRLIRGELSNPIVYQIDLSTISGMKESMTQVQSGDIIYIEPWRRPFLEGLRDARDFTSILGVFSSVLTMIVLFQTLNQ